MTGPLLSHERERGFGDVEIRSSSPIWSSGLATKRAVATRLCPAASIASASARPRPRELPVINHTFGIGISFSE
jgi:hypothetical protein